MSSTHSSTGSFRESRPFKAILDALDRRRLSHGLILSGDSLSVLESAAHHLGERILRESGQPLPLTAHPDFLTLRPVGKMRQIKADATREFARIIHHSPMISERKVAVIYNADCMNVSSANIFLKTLEEPPLDTTIIMLTHRPYSLSPTIRSRCLHFRLGPAGVAIDKHPAVDEWIKNYRGWIAGFSAEMSDKQVIAQQVMGLYGLVARFDPIMKQATAASLERQKKMLGDKPLSDEERTAIEEGLRVATRDEVFAAIEEATRRFAGDAVAAGDSSAARPFTRSIAALERAAWLTRLNIKEPIAIEGFLLASLRFWSRR